MRRLIPAAPMIGALMVLLAPGRNCHGQADEHPFPVSFRFHCGGKAKYDIPDAMGFSPDNTILGIAYHRRLILVDVATGKELIRVRTSEELNVVNYNYVVFDPSGHYCCISEFGHGGIDLQFFNIEKGTGSEPIERSSPIPANPSDYQSHGYHLPLRQWLAFQTVEHPNETTCEVMFSNPGGQVEKLNVSISFQGDKNLQEAERIHTEMFPPLKKPRTPWPSEEAKKFEAELQSGAGSGLQVALSQDRRLLLTQRISGETISFQYRFRFHDVKSKETIAEIAIPTGIDWRFNGSRGFAFSPDFRYLARTNPGGRVIVHDLSTLVDRKLDGFRSILIPFRDKIGMNK